jgi:hypothetical protein
MSSYHKSAAKLVVLSCALALTACAIEKVPVTDRGNLAKGVMNRDVDAQGLAVELHNYTSKEHISGGGGYSIGGGGCGCD